MTEVMLLFAIFLIIPLLFGTTILELVMVKNVNKISGKADNIVFYMIGVMFMFTLFEALAVVAVKLNFTLSDLSSLFMGMNCLFVVLSLFIGRKRMLFALDEVRKAFRPTPIKVVIAILFLLVLVSLGVYEPYSDNHTTEETVLTTLFSDKLYENNPLTGMKMTNGMYPINQLYTTPLFEAVMIHISGADAVLLMEYIYPAFVIFAHFLVIWLWARETTSPRICMLFYMLLVLFSENSVGMGAFSLLHQGVVGNVFALQVIVPFAFYVLWKSKTMSSVWWRVLILAICTVSAVMHMNLTIIKDFLFIKSDKTMAITWVILLCIVLYYIANKYPLKKVLPALALFVAAGIICLIPALVAYVLANIYGSLKDNDRRKRMVFGTIVLILLGGSCYLFTSGDAVKRISAPTAEEKVIEQVMAYKNEIGKASITLAAPREVMEIARKKSASIMLPFGRDYWNPSVNKEIGDIYDDEAYALYANLVDMKDLINKDTVLTTENEEHLLRVAALAKGKECDVFVTTALLPECGYAKPLKEIDGYFLYSVVK